MRGSVGGMLPWAMRALALCSAAGCLGYMVSNRPTPAVPREERRDPCLRLDERDKDELEIQQETPSWVFLSFIAFDVLFLWVSVNAVFLSTLYITCPALRAASQVGQLTLTYHTTYA